MKSKNLNEMSSEALLKQEKTVKVVTGTLAGMLLLLLVMGIVMAFEKGFNAFIIMPFGLLPIVFLNLNHLKEIKKELDARKDVL
ncbi:redox-active disulfide protein 2 [Fibrisoma montanum]|uniref:Redox-active disulfide protein 2 n=1 Tax=Fibrisoma montanum TaxID=2305895 RepID=A0A418MB25_9BACT|nr:redox-active disulfide protein 2 [Fibrisoma montanum]RIV23575.1 redox-active disulfide protein 2 [Fibrisoma montanum]